MAAFTIAGLTIKEAVRRKTLLGAFIMGLFILGLSLLLLVVHYRMELAVSRGRISPERMAIQYPITQSLLMFFCMSLIKILSAVFAAMLAGGAISSEIERGLLAVVLPKPIPRAQILLGKWIGLNLILVGCTLTWTVMIWASFTLQLHRNLTALLQAGLYMTLFPIVVSTLALTFSTVSPRLFGTIIALTMCAFAWFDSIFDSIGTIADADILHILADFAGMVVPQSYIGYWSEDATQEIIQTVPRAPFIGHSPRPVKTFGQHYLHFAHLDAVYVAGYILIVFLIGLILFQRRDV